MSNSSKITVSSSITHEIHVCEYKVRIKFSVYDVLDGQELVADAVYFNNKLQNVEVSSVQVLEHERFNHAIDSVSTKLLNLRIEKIGYFPFEGSYMLTVTSIYQDVIEIDLGRIGLLNEMKEDAIVLSWHEHPIDLDVRLLCPNGEVVGVMQSSSDNSHLLTNYYANVSIDDSNAEGPETIVMNHWVNPNDKYKIGGKFRFYVNWFKD